MLAIRLLSKVCFILSSSNFLAAFGHQQTESSTVQLDVHTISPNVQAVSIQLAKTIPDYDRRMMKPRQINGRNLEQEDDSPALPEIPQWFKHMPSWLEDLQNQTVQQGKDYIIKINVTEKNFYGETIVSIQPLIQKLGTPKNFCIFQPESNLLYINGTALIGVYAGQNFTIKVIANFTTDRYREIYENSFVLYVNRTEVPQNTSSPDDNWSNTHNRTIWKDEILGQLEAEPFESGKPVPYIVSLSETGLLTIGWDTQMEVYSGTKDLSNTKIAVRQKNNPVSSTLIVNNTIEKREEDVSIFKNLTVWNDTARWEEDLSFIYPILVKLVSEGDGVVLIRNVDWILQSSDKDFTKIQLTFENSNLICMEESRLEISFWGVEFFKSEEGKNTRRGQTLHWNVFRQACHNAQEEAESLDFIFILYCIALCVLLPVSFLIGNPVPLWLHLHSLQLMTYLQLLKDPVMPDNLSLFFDKFLRIIRFNNPSITFGINDAYDASRRSHSGDHIILEHNNTLLQQLGYGPFFFSNMPIILGFLGLSCLFWAFTALKNSRKVPEVCRRKCPKLLRRSGQDHILLGNFTLRFCHTFFLEMTICCYLSLQKGEMSSAGAVIQWIFSLGYLLVSLALIGYLVSMFWRRGPSIPGYYQKLTLWSLMCWGTRPINSQYDYKKQLQEYRKVQVTKRRQSLNQKNRRVSYQISSLDHRNKPQHKIKIKGNQCQPVNQIEEETPPQTERHLLETDDEHGKTSNSAKLTSNDKKQVPILIQLVDQNSCIEQITEGVPNSNEKLIPNARKQLASNSEKEQKHLAMQQFEGGSEEQPILPIGETVETTIVTPRPRLESIPIKVTNVRVAHGPVPAVREPRKEQLSLSKSVQRLRENLRAKIHVEMEKTVELPRRIETLFLGLKVNHQKNATLVYPLAYIARQILLAAIFVLAPGRPLGLHLVMFSTLSMLCYVCTEKQWKDASINTQHAVNEAVLYLLCVLMFYFCSVETSVQSRQTVGRYFIAVFALCLLGNILILSNNGVKHLILVLKKRFVRLSRQRLAREVFLKMKLINQILFSIAQDDQSRPADEQSQKMKSMKDWFDKSWFEPKLQQAKIQSPSRSEKETKIQMKPVRTAYGGLQGTFILSESHKPLSFDHISSIRDLSCSKQLTPAHVTDWSLFELQREFQSQDNNRIFDRALQNHVRQFLNQPTPLMTVEYVESVSRFTESGAKAWYSASSLSDEDEEDHSNKKLDQIQLKQFTQKPPKRLQENNRPSSETKFNQEHIMNRQISKQLFHSPKVMTSRITTMPAYQPQYGELGGYGLQQHIPESVLHRKYLYSNGPQPSEYSEIKQVTPTHAIMFHGSNHGRGSTSKVSQGSIQQTAKFHKESTQLRIFEKPISVENSDVQQLSRDVAAPLKRLELNDTGLIDQLALIPQRRKEDSHSMERSDFSLVGDRNNSINPGRQKTFVSCLLQKQDISRLTEESNVVDMMSRASDSASKQQVIEEEELRASDGPSEGPSINSPERHEHTSNSQILPSRTNSDRTEKKLKLTSQITHQDPTIGQPLYGLSYPAEPKIKMDSPIRISLYGLPNAISSEKSRTDRVLEFFREQTASDKNSYQDHSGRDPFDQRDRQLFGNSNYQSVERSISKRGRGRNSSSDQKRKNPAQVSWINSSRPNSQDQIVEPLGFLREENNHLMRVSYKRNHLFKMQDQNSLNEQQLVKPILKKRRSSTLKYQGSEIVQSQSLVSRSQVVLSEESCYAREREGFSRVLSDRSNAHKAQTFDEMLSNFQAFTKNPKLRVSGGSFERKPSNSMDIPSFNLSREQDQKLLIANNQKRQTEVSGISTLQAQKPKPFQYAILDTLHKDWPFTGRANSAVPASEVNEEFKQGIWPRRVEPSNQDMREKISFLLKLNKQNQEQTVPQPPVLLNKVSLASPNTMTNRNPNFQFSVARLQESVNMTTGMQVIQNRTGEARTTITSPTNNNSQQRDYRFLNAK